MAGRHDKFRAYWESIGKPPLEVIIEQEQNPRWLDCRRAPSWAIWNDYRIKDDPQWELRRKWIESDFKLPIQFFVSADEYGDDRWVDCRTPVIWNSNSFKYREKPKSDIVAAILDSAQCKIKDEQLQEASKMADEIIKDDEGWIPHTPGDPMPCDGDIMVHVKYANGLTPPITNAAFYKWDTDSKNFRIIAWKQAVVRAVIAENGQMPVNSTLNDLDWIPHTPGDPMPCHQFTRVHVKILDGSIHLDPDNTADSYNWNDCGKYSIIAWKPATGETKPSLAEEHPLHPILMKAIEQCMHGKGERHGGARTPFLEQRWHNISKSTGFRSLVYQACKKMEEACGKDDYEAFEREMLGGIVYAGMALLHVGLHGYTKEVKVEE